MEIDSLTGQTELLRGQSGNIVRMFVNPRQDKLSNLLASGVSRRSHRLWVSAIPLLREEATDIVKVISNIVKFIIEIVKRPFSASTTFVDLNTLQATVPSMPTGPLRVTVTNPDGQKYAFDDAFTVN